MARFTGVGVIDTALRAEFNPDMEARVFRQTWKDQEHEKMQAGSTCPELQ
ncbi:hypothetical protein [Candidatus Entotheonella palauensis]|nr:hypothetical protein [Candidatus Entotheonella palauensis]